VIDQGWSVAFAAAGNPSAQISVMCQDVSASVSPHSSIEVDDVDTAHCDGQCFPIPIPPAALHQSLRSPGWRAVLRRLCA
jgi:hypothetical protein